jgi:hypothetical protein
MYKSPHKQSMYSRLWIIPVSYILKTKLGVLSYAANDFGTFFRHDCQDLMCICCIVELVYIQIITAFFWNMGLV